MIPKEVTEALEALAAGYESDCKQWSSGPTDTNDLVDTIKNFLETTDRYVRDLEQHVDDLADVIHNMEGGY